MGIDVLRFGTMKTEAHTQIRVVLADDHAMVRKGIREFLEEDSTIRVVAEASDGAEAVALVAREHPDVAVFDIQMPRLNGLDAARRVRKESPRHRDWRRHRRRDGSRRCRVDEKRSVRRGESH